MLHWTVQEAGPVLMGPGEDGVQRAALARLPVGVAGADDMDPVRDGLAIIEAQRAAVEHTNGQVAVGAFV